MTDDQLWWVIRGYALTMPCVVLLFVVPAIDRSAAAAVPWAVAFVLAAFGTASGWMRL